MKCLSHSLKGAPLVARVCVCLSDREEDCMWQLKKLFSSTDVWLTVHVTISVNSQLESEHCSDEVNSPVFFCCCFYCVLFSVSCWTTVSDTGYCPVRLLSSTKPFTDNSYTIHRSISKELFVQILLTNISSENCFVTSLCFRAQIIMFT